MKRRKLSTLLTRPLPLDTMIWPCWTRLACLLRTCADVETETFDEIKAKGSVVMCCEYFHVSWLIWKTKQTLSRWVGCVWNAGVSVRSLHRGI